MMPVCLKSKNMKLPLIQEANLNNKIVLVRLDHNVVKSGEIHDPYRIDATIGTLFHIVAKGGKLILMTHVGRPKDTKTDKIIIDAKSSIQPIVDYLIEKLHISIKVPEFYAHNDEGYLSIETNINHLIRELRNDTLDAIYLPNTRWFKGEEADVAEQDRFANQLAGLADIFINDAFGSWQPHASTVGVNKYLPSYAGYLMQKEINNLERIFEADKPFVAIVAGSKFDTKIEPLYALLKKADRLILGGVIYNAYLCAKYHVSINGIGEKDIELAKQFIAFSKNHPGKIIELPFIVESDSIEGKLKGKYRTLDIRNFKGGEKLNYILDVDPESFEVKDVKNVFGTAKTIFVNAVMGFTPHFNDGTIALDSLIDQNYDAVKLYGGGDTMQELKRLLPGLYIMALDSPKYYIFTGGGAVLKAIEQGSSSGIEPIQALLTNNGKR